MDVCGGVGRWKRPLHRRSGALVRPRWARCGRTPDRTRTCNLRGRSSLLYPVELRGRDKGRPLRSAPGTLLIRLTPRGRRLASAGMVGVAQLVRAPGCGPGGRGFESPRSPVESLSAAIPAPLAQLVEHRTLNPQVLGSSPRGCTTRNPRSAPLYGRPGVSTFRRDSGPWPHGGHASSEIHGRQRVRIRATPRVSGARRGPNPCGPVTSWPANTDRGGRTRPLPIEFGVDVELHEFDSAVGRELADDREARHQGPRHHKYPVVVSLRDHSR